MERNRDDNLMALLGRKVVFIISIKAVKYIERCMLAEKMDNVPMKATLVLHMEGRRKKALTKTLEEAG